MEPPTEFTAESVRDYILSKGGKVTNHELVKHFKQFLTDPVMKDTARAQFKEYVNTLASIKLEDGEKYLVLKKKYRQGLLAEVLSDVGSEYSYASYSTAGSTPDPPDLGLPPPRAPPPPYRPPPPAPFPGPAPYQPPGSSYSPTYRTVSAPGGPPVGPPGPLGSPGGPYGAPPGPPSPAVAHASLGHERSPALDEYYHVPESRPLPAVGRPADPQPLGLPPAPPPELLARAAPRRQAEQPRRQAPLPAPPPPPAEPLEWRPPPPADLPLDRRPPPPPTELAADRPSSLGSPPAASPAAGEPAPPVPPRRRSGGGKENQTPPPDAAAAAEVEAALAAARESAAEEERQKKISVKEQTQKFNRIASESQVLQPKQFNKRRDRNDKTMMDDEDSSSTTTFEGVNKDWILASSSCKYMEIVRMLKDNPKLAKHKDFITGYTALHWAAKNGNLDIIKLIAGTHGVEVDSASHGGYTPLHIAMQYGHEDVFDLLVHTYGADANMRDHSGKKPRQYMVREETTLSSEAFRKIKKKRHAADKDNNSFLRIGSLNVRVKKTTEAFNSLITTGLNMGDRLHGRWGSSDSVNDADRDLMPPPHSKFSIKKRKSKKPQDFQNLKSRISAPILQPGGGLPMPEGGNVGGAEPTPPDVRRHSEADLTRISVGEDAVSQGGSSFRGEDSDSDYGFGSGWVG